MHSNSDQFNTANPAGFYFDYMRFMFICICWQFTHLFDRIGYLEYSPTYSWNRNQTKCRYSLFFAAYLNDYTSTRPHGVGFYRLSSLIIDDNSITPHGVGCYPLCSPVTNDNNKYVLPEVVLLGNWPQSKVLCTGLFMQIWTKWK